MRGGGGGGKAPRTHMDALGYLQVVQDTLQDQPGMYDAFLQIMTDYRALRIGDLRLITLVEQLFRGHPDLILGFNAYLPEGSKITLAHDVDEQPPPQSKPVHPLQKKSVEFHDTIVFINKIKTRLQGDAQVYKAFLEVLRRFREGQIPIAETCRSVAELFKDHYDLLQDLAHFLPENSATTFNFRIGGAP